MSGDLELEPGDVMRAALSLALCITVTVVLIWVMRDGQQVPDDARCWVAGERVICEVQS